MSNEAVADAPINAELDALIDSKFREFREGSIVNGTILDIRPQVVIVDIGYKSEGVIPASEFEDDEIEEGDEVEVLLERLENDEGMVVLSKEKAAHKQNWEKIVKVFEDGGLVKGKVKSVVTMSVEIQRKLGEILKKRQRDESDYQLMIVVNPKVFNRLRTEDEQIVIQMEKKYFGKLSFRPDPSYHYEEFRIVDLGSDQELARSES